MSMVVMTLAVQADGEDKPTTLKINPRQVLQWERKNPGRAVALLNDDAVTIGYLYEIAYLVLDQPGGDFARFCQTTDVAFGQDVPASTTTEGTPASEDGDPTQPAAPTTS